MAERQRALVATILDDPDVESVSSFIGVDGSNVTLKALRDRPGDGGDRPLQINHLGQFPSTTISFNLQSDYSLGEAVTQIRQAELEMCLPHSSITRF